MDNNGDQNSKRRRIVIEDDEETETPADDSAAADDENSVGSNPDNLVTYQDEADYEDEGDGEDLNENWLSDYAAVPELDVYDANDLASDDGEYGMTAQQRRAADDVINARLRERQARKDQRFLETGIDDDDESIDLGQRAIRLQPRDEIDEDSDLDDDNNQQQYTEQEVNLEAFDVPLREWIIQDRTRREIQNRFRKFLLFFRRRNENELVYPPRIRDMIRIFDEVLKEVVKVEFRGYTERVSNIFHVRIKELPISDKLRDLRQDHLNCLIRVNGVVTKRTGVFPQMLSVAYDCSACGEVLGPFPSSGGRDVKPGSCTNCQSSGPFRVNTQKTEYGNYQKITLQESPGSVPPGRVPRYKEVVLHGDLTDIARPGEEIEVTGIYMHSQIGVTRDRSGFPVFGTIIEANCVQKNGDTTSSSMSDSDVARIRELSQDPQIGERIIRSIAPSIYGHRHVKTALALSLFGGRAKDSGEGGTHRVRGDINVLLLGDPGTAKSQLLKYAEKIAPRSVYTTGKGASAVGLTAGVHRDPLTKEWTLEGGALVLADQGVCLIDEFDKMSEQDRTSIHEAMEQQTISVSKAGIVTSLQARCAVLAAANPIGGRYDPSYSLSENVELTDPILQRFDILCVLQDIVDPVVDEQLATFVVNSHMRSHPDADPALLPVSMGGNVVNVDKDGGPQPIDQILLKKYITYARIHTRPMLHAVDSEKIASLYADLRTQSATSGGVPIAVRHIESVMRMSEASARMHLRDFVRDDDVDLAIKVMLESFLQAQKVSVRRELGRAFRKYTTFGEEKNQLLMHQLQGLLRDSEKYQQLRYKKVRDTVEVFIDDLEKRARDLNIFDLRPFYSSRLFKSHGLRVDETLGSVDVNHSPNIYEALSGDESDILSDEDRIQHVAQFLSTTLPEVPYLGKDIEEYLSLMSAPIRPNGVLWRSQGFNLLTLPISILSELNRMPASDSSKTGYIWLQSNLNYNLFALFETLKVKINKAFSKTFNLKTIQALHSKSWKI
eukprot:gene2923-5737_t